MDLILNAVLHYLNLASQGPSPKSTAQTDTTQIQRCGYPVSCLGFLFLFVCGFCGFLGFLGEGEKEGSGGGFKGSRGCGAAEEEICLSVFWSFCYYGGLESGAVWIARWGGGCWVRWEREKEGGQG